MCYTYPFKQSWKSVIHCDFIFINQIRHTCIWPFLYHHTKNAKYGHRMWQSRAEALNFIEHYTGRLFPHPISTKIESFISEQVAKTSTTQNTGFSVVNYGPVDIILPCVFMFIKKRIKKYKTNQGQIIPGQQWNTFPESLTFLGNNLIHFLAVLWNCRK